MPHDYNKEAFGRIGNDSSNPLCAVYCSLVVLELAIKDYLHQKDNQWKNGHRIIDWLTHDLQESSLGVQLQDELAKLYCTDKNGNGTMIDANKYPDLRYLRHEQDFPGTSTDDGLKDVMYIINDIKNSLRNKGTIV